MPCPYPVLIDSRFIDVGARQYIYLGLKLKIERAVPLPCID
ncbi:hypothetical protein [Microseira wollei]|nr:hypothetical protein [Microseira wollei]